MISNQVLAAVKQAKAGLSDLVTIGVLLKVTQTYNESNGQYTNTETQTSIECVPTKFEYNELLQGDIRQTDIKIIIFNTEATFDISTKDKIRYNGIDYMVLQSVPTKVGPYTPIYEVVLRK